MSNPRVDDVAEYCRRYKGGQAPGDEVRKRVPERSLDGLNGKKIFLVKKIS